MKGICSTPSKEGVHGKEVQRTAQTYVRPGMIFSHRRVGSKIDRLRQSQGYVRYKYTLVLVWSGWIPSERQGPELNELTLNYYRKSPELKSESESESERERLAST